MTVARRAAANWAAVLILIVSGVAFVASVIFDGWPESALSAAAGIVQFVFEYVPGVVALLIGIIVLAYGGKRLSGLPGNGRIAPLTFFLWGLLLAISELAFLGELTADPVTSSRALVVQNVTGIAAIVVGIVAAVFVYRAGVVHGFARIALFVTVLLCAISEIFTLVPVAWVEPFIDLPRLAGLVVLGVAYLRAGTSTDHLPGQ